MQEAEEEASLLGLTAYEYFRSRKESFHIVQEEYDEVGQHRDWADYSKLREQWYSRKKLTEPLPWAWEEMLALCKRFEVRRGRAKSWQVGQGFAIVGVVLTAVGIVLAIVFEVL